MKGSHKWLSNLKFRVGWGTTGNNNTKNFYPSQLLYSGDQNYAFNNSIDNPAIYISQMPNKDFEMGNNLSDKYWIGLWNIQ